MGSNRRYIPLEIVEEIVLNLPVKSVVRFSTVSKSWNSIVSELGFIKRYRGREMMGLMSITSDPLSPSSLASFSSLSSLTAEDATNLIYKLKASCDELWCIEIENALFLNNPSMKACRKLPDPHEFPYPRYPGEYGFYGFVYGLGYDAVGDDYKLLKCPRDLGPEMESELYSLRSDSWRKISPHEICLIMGGKFVFFNGMLHCICQPRSYNRREGLLRFDLSTDKYGEIVPVPERYQSKLDNFSSGMTVLRGKLCVFFNTFDDFMRPGPGFYLLEIDEEYSWTIKFHIDCRYQTIPNTPQDLNQYVFYRLIPLYLYDNGDILMNFFRDISSKILMYKKEENIFIDGSCNEICDGVVYVQTLVSL